MTGYNNGSKTTKVWVGDGENKPFELTGGGSSTENPSYPVNDVRSLTIREGNEIQAGSLVDFDDNEVYQEITSDDISFKSNNTVAFDYSNSDEFIDDMGNGNLDNLFVVSYGPSRATSILVIDNSIVNVLSNWTENLDDSGDIYAIDLIDDIYYMITYRSNGFRYNKARINLSENTLTISGNTTDSMNPIYTRYIRKLYKLDNGNLLGVTYNGSDRELTTVELNSDNLNRINSGNITTSTINDGNFTNRNKLIFLNGNYYVWFDRSIIRYDGNDRHTVMYNFPYHTTEVNVSVDSFYVIMNGTNITLTKYRVNGNVLEQVKEIVIGTRGSGNENYVFASDIQILKNGNLFVTIGYDKKLRSIIYDTELNELSRYDYNIIEGGSSGFYPYARVTVFPINYDSEVTQDAFKLFVKDTNDIKIGNVYVYNNQVSGLYDVYSHMGIAVDTGSAGEDIEVAVGGYCHVPGATKNSKLETSGLKAYAVDDDWYWIKPYYDTY